MSSDGSVGRRTPPRRRRGRSSLSPSSESPRRPRYGGGSRDGDRGRRRSRSGRRRSRSRSKREEPREIRIGVQSGPKGEIVFEPDVRGFLRQWADVVGKVELGVAPLEVDEPGWHFSVVEITNHHTRQRILDWFNSPRGRRYLVLKEMAVKVQEWPLRRISEDDREAEVIPWKWRKGASSMLSDEFPNEKVLALDSAEGRRYYFKSEHIHRTEGAASFIEQRRKDGATTKRTVCHHWRRDAHCRFGSECAYIHIKAGAEREDAGAGPSANSMLASGKGKFMTPAFGGSMRGPPNYLMPGAPPLFSMELDEISSSSEDDAPAELPPVESKTDYLDTLLVRDVDRDTDARGVRRMKERDFEKMWREIEGFKNAELVRGDKKRMTVPKYGGCYGTVGFQSEEQAVGAMEQTFGCEMNVSFYGVQEMLEDCTAEQQAWCQKNGIYSDRDARATGRLQ